MKPAVVLLTHSPSALANYYGARALAALEAVARVQRNASEEAWRIEALTAAAADCDIIVSDRRAEGSAALLTRLPRLVAFCRCAVDIRNVDVAAASAQGILVTQASAGFMTSVAEWVLGVMIDLSRHLSARGAAVPRRPAAAGANGPRIARRHARPDRLRPDRPQLWPTWRWRWACASSSAILLRPCRASRAKPAALLARPTTWCAWPGTPETENLMDAARCAMNPDAVFINASRGNLVDEVALLQKRGRQP